MKLPFALTCLLVLTCRADEIVANRDWTKSALDIHTTANPAAIQETILLNKESGSLFLINVAAGPTEAELTIRGGIKART